MRVRVSKQVSECILGARFNQPKQAYNLLCFKIVPGLNKKRVDG